MFRKSALVLALGSVLATGNAVALGLGEIDLKSALNQPFNAEVELLSATEDELNELKVILGSRQAFASAGINRTAFLSKLKFNVTRNSANRPIIRITSRNPVQEPFLDFLLEVSWSKGKLLREYTVLVDPPVTMPAAPVTLQAPVVPAPVAAPAATAPVTAPPVQPQRTHTAIMPPVAKLPVGSGAEYGPTRRSETLWKIAQKVRPDTGVSMEQTMLALLRENPEAFINNNINNLKTGYVLRIPSREEMVSIGKAAARAESRAQYTAWREARSGGSTVATAATSESAVAADSAGGSKLKLVAPDLGEASSGSVGEGAADTSVEALQRELVLANEALEAQRSESQEMAKRLGVLEEQIQNMQRLIQLKDDELARLQSGATGSTATEAIAPEQAAMTETGADQAPVNGEQADQPETVAPTGATDETSTGLPVPEVTTPEASEADVAAASPQAAIADEKGAMTSSPFGFVDQLLKNPLWLGAGGLVLALLAFFGLRSRRPVETDFQESILRTGDGAADDMTDFSESSLGESSLISEFAVSDMVADEHQGDSDPIAEADVYLAYGRFQQAEELVREALAEDPDNEDLNLKLFEIYQASGNAEGFDEQAQALFAKLGSADHPMWQKVVEMGLAVNPNNPLFHPDGAAPVSDNSHEETAMNEPAGNDANVVDFDASDTGQVAFDPDINAISNEVSEAVDDNSVDFDLGGFDVGGETEDSDGELADLDEISTKLDLARAYIDMGDPEGARNILGEVIEEGNDDQKNEAQGILERLAS